MNDPFIYGLLIISFLFFLLLKYAFSSINYLQFELDKKKLNSQLKILNFISKNTLEFIICIHIYYFIGLATFVYVIKDIYLDNLQTINPYSITILIAITFVLFLGILSIITFAKYFASKIIRFFAIPLFFIYVLLMPVTIILKSLLYIPVNLLYKTNKEEKQSNFDKNDLDKLVSDNQDYALVEETINPEIRLFKNALEFSDTKVRECMIPRTELVALELNDIDTIKQKFISSGLSKILIYRESIDNIIGYIRSKNLFIKNTNIKSAIKKLPIFPESMNANKLLKFFIRSGQNMAVIVDEFGGTSGIVTTEDILEEIFGEIKDEHDTENLYEKQLTDTSFVFSGRLEIDYINKKYKLGIPEDDEYETIAGFILYHTENIPTINELITIENLNFNILKVSNTRIELVKLEIDNE